VNTQLYTNKFLCCRWCTYFLFLISGEVLCKFVHFFPVFLVTCSCYTLVGISFERRHAILESNCPQFTITQALRAIPVIWTGSFLVSLPTLLEFSLTNVSHEENHTEQASVQCGNTHVPRGLVLTNGILVTLVSFLVPLIWIFINYIKLITFVKTRCKQVSTIATGDGSQSNGIPVHGYLSKNKFRLIKMFVLMTSSFTVWWTPFFILRLYVVSSLLMTVI